MDRLTTLRRVIAREVIDLGVPHGAVRPEQLRRIRIISITTIGMCLAAGLPSLLQFDRMGMHLMVACIGATMAAAIGNLLLLRAQRNPQLAAHLGVAILGSMLLFSQTQAGGFYDPNFAWLYVLPLCAAAVIDMRGAALWTGVVLAATLTFWLLPEVGADFPNQVPVELRRSNALFNRVTTILAIGVIASSFVIGQRRAEHQLARTNDDLVHETAYVQLLMHGAVAANEASSFEDALRESIHRICEDMNWIAGQAYTVAENGYIVSSGIAYTRDDRLEALRDYATSQIWEPGVGLVGRAAERGAPQFRNDHFRDAAPSEEVRIVREAGIRAAIAVPVFVNGSVAAVMEFASTYNFQDAERLLDVFSLVGHQIGRVAERTALNDRMQQAQKMEAVGQLAAGVAHEINNPMSYVRSNLHTLREEWEELRAKLSEEAGREGATRMEECQELIDDSLEGVERTIAIVRDVREFSHEGVTDREDWKTASLADLMNGALRVASAQAPADVHVESFHEGAAEVRCSPNQIRQVLINLVVNAIQAVGESGNIRLVTGRDGDEIFARVEDDGPGMTQTTRDRLFDPFFTTKPVGEGTGLGLSVSYEIVRNHGGEILVRSSPGAGAAFELRLPAEAAAERA